MPWGFQYFPERIWLWFRASWSKANGQEDVKVFVGGIIPDEDVPRLMEMGVVGVYGPGTLTDQIVQDIRKAVWEGAGA
jgi:methylmalonyl-CoA mutase cobalamin-binding domain/chain